MANLQNILVVGAGPTGLTAAAILAKHGVTVRIIDQNASRSDKSKALAIQAGTLECLHAAFGEAVVEKLIAAGVPVYSAFQHLDEAEPVAIDLSVIPSRYNYILVLAQSETEHILEEFLGNLGVRVERGTTLTDLKSDGDEVTAGLQLPDGRAETAKAAFAIGADGAHSVVRRSQQIEFRGGSYSGDFILGDVKLKWPWSYDSVRAFINRRGVIGAFPLGGDHHYRLIMVLKNGETAPPQPEISLPEFRGHLDNLSGGQIVAEESYWLSRFRVSHRMAANFQKGRMFLAGDAAHIHSPAGGQGMNTGIQDALNLGFKIKAVFAGAPLSLLSEYEDQRLPVARRIVRATDIFSRAMLLPETPVSGWIRRHLMPRLAGTGWIQRRMVTAISQVDIAHREIPGYK